ncbi:TPA: phospholipase D-like domain-containing protein [Clostridioides difficile]
MRNEIKINDDVKLIMTNDEFGYSEVLDTLENAAFVRIVTYNISAESKELIEKIENFKEDKDVVIITNIPARFKKYTSSYARNRAKKTISNYIDKLNPEKYDANIRTFFNFGNHSKIIMTDIGAYIGSANFSDESRKNNECGVLIKDKNVINEINNVFIQMQIDESVSYYSSEYMKVFISITNLLTKAKMYYEDYYWSFFADSGHQHHGRGDEYRGFNACLSPILIEDLSSLSYEIEDVILELNNNEVYPEIFEDLDLSICEEIRTYFGTDSELEEFSRFDCEDKTYELFEEYILDGDPDRVDYYAQLAADNASDMNISLVSEIYQTSLDGMKVIEKIVDFLLNILKMLDKKKGVNTNVDNT